ncbi:MAG: response regulator [Alphaproteobacteria bacterium]
MQLLRNKSENRIHVLSVEDSRTEALLYSRKITAADDGRITIHNVGTLGEALDYLRTNRVDVVLLDLGLPDSDGVHSIHELNSKFPHLPIVILSAREDELSIMSYLEYGAQEFLLKGECSGAMVRQSIYNAMFRKSLHK